MPVDAQKALDHVRQEAASSPHDIAQVMALQRIAASLECIRAEIILLQGVIARRP